MKREYIIPKMEKASFSFESVLTASGTNEALVRNGLGDVNATQVASLESILEPKN